MGNTRRKIPPLTLADIVLIRAQVWIDGGDPRPTFKHKGPLRLLMPVHLPDRTGLQTHVYSSHCSGDRHFSDCRLPRPAAVLQAIVAVSKGPFQIG